MKSVSFITGASIAILLSGCMQNYQATSPNGQSSQTKNGALIGAALGGILGASSGDDQLEKAVLGAALGGALGGAIGHQLEKQKQELEQSLGNDDVKIVNTGSNLIVTLPQDILFATDSAVVVPGLQSDLRKLASNLQNYPDTSVRVIGHTDNTGAAEYNYDLSNRRAAAVSTILTASGVQPQRIFAQGQGENIPLATNLTPEGRAQNRRVEVVITPNT